jgi:hypothetical protein
MMVTACAKCQVHFRCALRHATGLERPVFDGDIRDITTLIADRLPDAPG